MEIYSNKILLVIVKSRFEKYISKQVFWDREFILNLNCCAFRIKKKQFNISSIGISGIDDIIKAYSLDVLNLCTNNEDTKKYETISTTFAAIVYYLTCDGCTSCLEATIKHVSNIIAYV